MILQFLNNSNISQINFSSSLVILTCIINPNLNQVIYAHIWLEVSYKSVKSHLVSVAAVALQWSYKIKEHQSGLVLRDLPLQKQNDKISYVHFF